MRIRPALLVIALALGACKERPSSAEAIAAFRSAQPGVDSSDAIKRIWADGPPWFSCAEVVAKLKSSSDSASVRNQVGAWRSLIVADWISLRDTAAGAVVEPGWCRITLHDAPTRLGAGWKEIHGDSLPSGGTRTGWDVVVGKNEVRLQSKTSLIGRDSARANYAIVVVPNQNGIATGAEHDTVQRTGVLAKIEGHWKLVHLDAER